MNKRQRKKARKKLDRALVRCMRALSDFASSSMRERFDRTFPFRRVRP